MGGGKAFSSGTRSTTDQRVGHAACCAFKPRKRTQPRGCMHVGAPRHENPSPLNGWLVISHAHNSAPTINACHERCVGAPAPNPHASDARTTRRCAHAPCYSSAQQAWGGTTGERLPAVRSLPAFHPTSPTTFISTTSLRYLSGQTHGPAALVVAPHACARSAWPAPRLLLHARSHPETHGSNRGRAEGGRDMRKKVEHAVACCTETAWDAHRPSLLSAPVRMRPRRSRRAEGGVMPKGGRCKP